MAEKRKDQNNGSSKILLGSAWNVIGGLLVTSLLGYAIGKKMGDEVTGTLVGMLIGLVYCSYEVWKLVRRLNSK